MERRLCESCSLVCRAFAQAGARLAMAKNRASLCPFNKGLYVVVEVSPGSPCKQRSESEHALCTYVPFNHIK